MVSILSSLMVDLESLENCCVTELKQVPHFLVCFPFPPLQHIVAEMILVAVVNCQYPWMLYKVQVKARHPVPMDFMLHNGTG